MTRQQASAVVGGMIEAWKKEPREFADRPAVLLGQLQEVAAQWLYELETLKAKKTEKEMDQLHRRLIGKEI